MQDETHSSPIIIAPDILHLIAASILLRLHSVPALDSAGWLDYTGNPPGKTASPQISPPAALRPERVRRHAGDGAEVLSEVVLAGETEDLRDFPDRTGIVAEQFLDPGDANPLDVLCDRAAESPAEAVGEIPP
jgi:hypothetical protein